MRRKRHIIVFGGLILVIAALLAFAFVFRSFTGIYVGDTSDSAMIGQLEHALTPEQQHFISMSFERIASVYLVFLVVTNALWLIGALYICKR